MMISYTMCRVLLAFLSAQSTKQGETPRLFMIDMYIACHLICTHDCMTVRYGPSQPNFKIETSIPQFCKYVHTWSQVNMPCIELRKAEVSCTVHSCMDIETTCLNSTSLKRGCRTCATSSRGSTRALSADAALFLPCIAKATLSPKPLYSCPS